MLACLLAIIIIFNMIITNIMWERFPNIIMNNSVILTLITVTMNIIALIMKDMRKKGLMWNALLAFTFTFNMIIITTIIISMLIVNMLMKDMRRKGRMWERLRRTRRSPGFENTRTGE